MMGRPFKVKRGRLLARLADHEKSLLAMVCDDLTEVLADTEPPPDVPEWARELGLADVGISREAPQDPVLARLLPDGYADPEQAADFRRMTEAGLRATKLANASVVRDALGRPGVIDITGEAHSWLAVLADSRLVLGTRLGVTDEEDVGAGDHPLGDLYLYLGWLQQCLVDALLGGLD